MLESKNTCILEFQALKLFHYQFFQSFLRVSNSHRFPFLIRADNFGYIFFQRSIKAVVLDIASTALAFCVNDIYLFQFWRCVGKTAGSRLRKSSCEPDYQSQPDKCKQNA